MIRVLLKFSPNILIVGWYILGIVTQIVSQVSTDHSLTTTSVDISITSTYTTVKQTVHVDLMGGKTREGTPKRIGKHPDARKTNVCFISPFPRKTHFILLS
jgi:hypothetical protein